MGIKKLYNDNLRKLPNEYGDVSVMNREHGNIPMFLFSLIFPVLMISLGAGQSNIPQLKYWICLLYNIGKFPCFTVC